MRHRSATGVHHAHSAQLRIDFAPHPMTLARRSWMIVSALDAAGAKRARDAAADVVVLDLEYTVAPKHKEAARAALPDLARELDAGACPVFARIDRATRWADVRAAVARGVRGIVYPGAEDPAEVAEIDALVAALERERGIESGSIELALLLESAPGFWHAAALAQASARVRTLGVGRIDLTMPLGPVPQDEFRLYRYLMTRTLVCARTFCKQPLGAHWRPGSRGGVADAQHTARAAREARLMGFEGCMCMAIDQIAPVNAGFSVQ
jgi:citrate lyase subunit beta/citryl-CoA lyase